MAMHQLELDRHHELAEFLRSRRERLSPEQVGLPAGTTRRRTPGLRRGEVSMLAGVSLEWYTWLEQGRDISVSVQLLESLARVLQLNSNEREHLFLLALKQPAPVETFTPPTISPTLQQFLNQLGTTPASIVDVRLNVVAWNKAHCLVFDHDDNPAAQQPNLIWRLFTAPVVRVNNRDWDELARIYLAQFRAGYGRFSEDPWWAEQIAALSQISPEFRELWARHDVLNLSEGHKTMYHPAVGDLYFDFLWLQAIDSRDLRLLVHTPRSGTDTAEKIARLLTLAAEESLQKV